MHLPVIFKVLSLLSAIVSLSMVLPLGWSLWDGSSDGKAFLLSISAGLIFSAVLFMAGKNADYNDIGVKDGFLVVSLSWIFASLIGALPFYISGTIPTFAGAFFESASGFTTTGASVLSDIEAVPRGILFWRSLTHWLGGMGIIVLSLAILPFLGVGGMELFKAEVPGPIPEKITPRIQQTALYLWGVYAFLTVAETVLLLLGGMNLFESLTHTFGTVATGGFSPLNRSVGQYGSAYFDWIITVFMFLSGINFVLHYRLLRGHFRPLARDDEFRTYLWIVLFCIAVISADLLFRGNYDSIAEALRYSAFQVVSIITTTGFATADFELWPSFTQLILLLLMFAGACAGSTGGGMKILRLLILSRHTRAELKRVLHPHAVISVKVGGKVIDTRIQSSVTSFLILYVAVFIAGVFFMTSLGMDMESAMSGVAASLGNVGPGLGSLGPMDNYSAVPEAGKWLFSLLMLMGRLELYTVLLLFFPGTWRK
ncbi:TrkH family potassium uptake protein [Aminivibrio sp.]|uniref:TrkH family potassium uptake protein n=1 Tax=Aminivibrio sp. TaxID=1872489 RepID=UPI0016B7FA3A|nr:TrkH family potassium uptake protein [Synergistaceae bacterium]MDD4022314.1 TrkH family potassium uptake protein [Synergistaceae bacterium]MDD4613604.1 TrkH family potassium uptake protein [Synergistaceae bacterium]NLO57529.1 TrkH family potassium uptake protein [Synergistaceae bacterium]